MSETLELELQAAFNVSTRRYVAACRAIARVQWLNLPAIQVKLATNQVVTNSRTGL
jgi:hypothetical protein